MYFAFKASDRADEAQQNLATARSERRRADESAKHADAEREDARDSLYRSLYNEARATLASGQGGRRWQALDLLQRSETLRGRERPGVPTRPTDSSSLPSQIDLRSEAIAALLTQDSRLIREIQISDLGTLLGGALAGGVVSRADISLNGTLAAADSVAPATTPNQPQEENEAIDPALSCLRVVDLVSARELLQPAGNAVHPRLCFGLSADGKQLASRRTSVARTQRQDLGNAGV